MSIQDAKVSLEFLHSEEHESSNHPDKPQMVLAIRWFSYRPGRQTRAEYVLCCKEGSRSAVERNQSTISRLSSLLPFHIYKYVYMDMGMYGHEYPRKHSPV
jgi:hypothetical protein